MTKQENEFFFFYHFELQNIVVYYRHINDSSRCLII